MSKRITTILIIILLIIVLGIIGVIIFNMISTNKSDKNDITETTKIKPEISLSQELTDENEVIVEVITSTQDENGIKEILLPDGSKETNDKTKYTITENGEYEFTVTANNGEKSSAKIIVEDIVERKNADPYVPEGFDVISDNVDEGFVIEDNYGNQYVWIPVEGGKMTRTTVFDTNYEENNNTASALVNSVAQNYGFYIARFEASEFEFDGKKVVASMPGKIPWTNITCLDAVDYSNSSAQVFGYEDCTTALMNSYAWDTALNWIDTKYENYSSSVDYGNYNDGLVNPTGTTEKDIVCQICDMAGNVSEWTTEIYKKVASSSSKNKSKNSNTKLISRVVRGGTAMLSRTAASRRGYAEDLLDPYWGFRMILYK